MTVGEKGKLTELELDLRVRDRLLASGVLTPAAIEAYLASLPDLEDQAETIAIEQPAIGPSTQAPRVEPALDNEGVE